MIFKSDFLFFSCSLYIFFKSIILPQTLRMASMVNNGLKNSAASYRVPLWKIKARQGAKLPILYGAPDFLLNFLSVLICLWSPKRWDFVHKQLMSSQVRTTIQLFGVQVPNPPNIFSKRPALKKIIKINCHLMFHKLPYFISVFLLSCGLGLAL